MRKLIRGMPIKHYDKINWGLINRSVDDTIERIITENLVSLNIVENISVARVEFNSDPADTDNKLIAVRRDRKKFPDVRYIGQSRLGCLTIMFHIVGTDGNTADKKSALVCKKMLIPLLDEKNQILLQGKNYNLIYQMVDKTLYPTASAVTVKSLLPICVKIYETSIKDVNGTEYNTYSHLLQVFKKFYNPLYLFAQHGLNYIMKIMEVELFITFHHATEDFQFDHDKYLYFKVEDIYVRVLKDAFEKFQYIQSMTTMTIEILDQMNATYANVNDDYFWTLVFADGKPEKAKSNRIFHARMLDITTQRKLFIDSHNKFTIHHLVRYIIMNYSKLWAYDNLSLDNKRLRCAEYIGSILTGEISKRINRVTILGPRATFDDYMRVVSFPPDIIIRKLHHSGMLRFDDQVNDLNGVGFMRFTKCGEQYRPLAYKVRGHLVKF